MSASYEIVEMNTGRSHVINPKLESAKNATIALAELNNMNTDISEDESEFRLSFRESGIHLPTSEANNLCNWLLQHGFGDTNVLKDVLIHRTTR